jgi:hypothetical protein
MKTLSSFKTLSTKKARNFLAKDGPGSFDQPGYNIPIFIRKVNMSSFFQIGIIVWQFQIGRFWRFFAQKQAAL